MEESKAKRKRMEEAERNKKGTLQSSGSSSEPKNYVANNAVVLRRIETGVFSKIPPELFHHILKFLSSEVTFLHCFCENFVFFFLFLRKIKRNLFTCATLCLRILLSCDCLGIGVD